MTGRPRLLFYCQHSVGLGHLVRSLALAEGLSERFDVTLLNGGRLPSGTRVPAQVEMVNLVPLGHDDEYQLVSLDPTYDVEAACRRRVATILDVMQRTQPDVVVLELFPFGRKKFEFELQPLLVQAKLQPNRALVVCSLRDILVNQRRDQDRHDERACLSANSYLDAILMHSDPQFATLEESFKPRTPLTVPVHYTGFVTASSPLPAAEHSHKIDRVIVSAGGGMVGGPLVRAAVAAHRQVWERTNLRTTIVGGPFLPESEWAWLQRQARCSPLLDTIRSVDNLADEMARSRVSVSQAGYNTTMDLLRSRVSSVVVPYSAGKEDEQTRRAGRLASLGALIHLPSGRLGPTEFADAVVQATGLMPASLSLNLAGRTRSAEIVSELLDQRRHALAMTSNPDRSTSSATPRHAEVR